MAIPAMTNNSPSAGQIAWGAFTIQYAGVSYSVSAGSTGQRWVWWRYNSGTPVIEAGPEIGQPFGGSLTPLSDDDLLLFGNKGGISLRVQATQVLDGELIVDGSIFADAIAANQIATSHIVTAGLDAGVVKFGTMSGDRIAANTMLVSSLVVTDLENLLDNPVAQLGAVNAAAPGWAGTIPAWFAVVPTTRSATLPDASTGPCLELTANGTSVVAINNRSSTVKPGDQLWVSGYVRKVSGTDAVGTIYPIGTVTTKQGGTLDTTTQPVVTDPAGVQSTMSVDISTLTAGTWVSYEGVYTVPAGGIKTQFYMNLGANIADGVYQFWGMEVRRKAAGKLIVDGSITSSQIDADDITAAIVQTGLLQAQFTLTGVLGISGANAGWSAADGLWLGDKVHLYQDSRTNQIEGDLVTSSLTVKDGLSIGGNADLHGTLAMGNGITTPTAKMGLGQTWPSFSKTTLGNPGDDNSNFYHGLHDYNGTQWLTAFTFFGTGLRVVGKAAGGWGGDLTLGSWKSSFYPTGSLCVIGGNAYLIGHDQSLGDETYIIRVNLSAGTLTARWRVGGTDPFNGKRPALVTDGTNVGMIWIPQSSGDLKLRWINPGLTAQVGSDITLYSNIGFTNVGDAYWGIGNAGGTARLWVSTYSGDTNWIRAWTASPTAPTRVSSEDFKRAGSSTVLGLCYDSAGQRMWHFDKEGTFWKYSNYITAQTLNAQYSWYDGDTTGVYPAGTIIQGVDKSGQVSTAHETTPSPVNTYALGARAHPTISAPPAPDELVTDATQVDKANRIGIYAAVGATPRLITYLPVGRRALDPLVEVTDPLSTVGVLAGSSTVPSFASAAVPAPGRLRSAAVDGSSVPYIDLYGSGAGRMGPYKWGATGAQLDGDPTFDSGWITGWATKPGNTPFPNNSSTVINYAKYRRVGGMVFLKISISLGANPPYANANHANNAVVGGFPVAYAPSDVTALAAFLADIPATVQITSSGGITWLGTAQAPSSAAAGPIVAGDTLVISGSWPTP